MEGLEIIGKTLKSANVKHVFGLVGHGNIPMIDGMDNVGIEFVSCAHESIAGWAADGYFRVTHNPGVVCLTCSPGALNAQLPIVQAGQDHSAVIYIVGDIPTKFAGKGTYEEVDLNGPDSQFSVLRPMFKRAWKVTRLELLSQYIANAFNVAQSGCPGPVLIDIPFDLQTEKVETEIIDVSKHCVSGKPEASAEVIEDAASLLLESKSPVLLAGGGVNLSDSSEEMLELSRLLGAPIVTTIAGSSSFQGFDPRVAGFIGSYGPDGANAITGEADLIFAVGPTYQAYTSGHRSRGNRQKLSCRIRYNSGCENHGSKAK
jgi:acetolactate synthase-1/2/3 large subunit